MNFFRQPPASQPSVDETSGLLARTDSDVDEEYPAKNNLQDCRNQQQSHLDSTDPYKLWLEINSHRHSAERYVNRYLNGLTKSCQFPEPHASTQENPNADASSEDDSDPDSYYEGVHAITC